MRVASAPRLASMRRRLAASGDASSRIPDRDTGAPDQLLTDDFTTCPENLVARVHAARRTCEEPVTGQRFQQTSGDQRAEPPTNVPLERASDATLAFPDVRLKYVRADSQSYPSSLFARQHRH